MPKITLVEFDGQAHVVEAEVGQSLMQVAIDNMVPGIDGDCGGACACGTCHCFLENRAGDDIDPLEESMLSMRPDRNERSRLSCQISVSEEMDGAVVRLPEFQM